MERAVLASGGILDLSGAAQGLRAAASRAVARGSLVRVAPAVFVSSGLADDPAVRARAALAHAGPGSALCCASALWAYGLRVPLIGAVHVASAQQRRPVPGIVVHRFQPAATTEREVGRACVAAEPLSVSLVRHWGEAGPRLGADPIFEATAQRLLSPADIRRVAQRRTRLRERATLMELLDLVASGARSSLEAMALTSVLNAPELPPYVLQHAIAVGWRRYVVDAAFPAQRVAVEFDGRRYHEGSGRIEYDRQRDVDLATLGWVTLRFSYERVRHDPAGVRRDLLAVLQQRGWTAA